jgi:hypothetical protein
MKPAIAFDGEKHPVIVRYVRLAHRTLFPGFAHGSASSLPRAALPRTFTAVVQPWFELPAYLEEKRSSVGDFDLDTLFGVASAAATIWFRLNEPVPLVGLMYIFRKMELFGVPRDSPSILAIFTLVTPYP